MPGIHSRQNGSSLDYARHAVGPSARRVTAWIWVGIKLPYLLGYTLDFHFAAGTAAWSVLLVLAMTAFAGWAAARQAGRQVLAAIQTE